MGQLLGETVAADAAAAVVDASSRRRAWEQEQEQYFLAQQKAQERITQQQMAMKQQEQNKRLQQEQQQRERQAQEEQERRRQQQQRLKHQEQQLFFPPQQREQQQYQQQYFHAQQTQQAEERIMRQQMEMKQQEQYKRLQQEQQQRERQVQEEQERKRQQQQRLKQQEQQQLFKQQQQQQSQEQKMREQHRLKQQEQELQQLRKTKQQQEQQNSVTGLSTTAVIAMAATTAIAIAATAAVSAARASSEPATKTQQPTRADTLRQEKPTVSTPAPIPAAFKEKKIVQVHPPQTKTGLPQPVQSVPQRQTISPNVPPSRNEAAVLAITKNQASLAADFETPKPVNASESATTKRNGDAHAQSFPRLSTETAKRTIYIRNIPSTVKEEQTIVAAFARYGKVTMVNYKKLKNSANLEFTSEVAAKAAVAEKTPILIGGKRVEVLECNAPTSNNRVEDGSRNNNLTPLIPTENKTQVLHTTPELREKMNPQNQKAKTNAVPTKLESSGSKEESKNKTEKPAAGTKKKKKEKKSTEGQKNSQSSMALSKIEEMKKLPVNAPAVTPTKKAIPSGEKSKTEERPAISIATNVHRTSVQKVKELLNRLTLENFVLVNAEMGFVSIPEFATLEEITFLVFNKALAEPHLGSVCATVCVHLSKRLERIVSMFLDIVEKDGRFYWTTIKSVPVADQLRGPFETREEAEKNAKIETSFRRIVLNLCQQELEAEAPLNDLEKEIKKKKEELLKMKEGDSNFKALSNECAIEIAKHAQMKQRILGNIQFIGELYKQKLVPDKAMCYCINTLLKEDGSEIDIECLCKFLQTAGFRMDDPNAATRTFMDTCFDSLKKLSSNQRLGFRHRVMIRDLIELRSTNWKEQQRNLPNAYEEEENIEPKASVQVSAHSIYIPKPLKISSRRCKLLRQLDVGGFSQVFQMEYQPTDGESMILAFKKFNTFQLNGASISKISGEIEILADLDHSNIVKLLGALGDPDAKDLNGERLGVGIMMEFCENGSLKKYLDDRTFPSIDFVIQIIVGVAEGMQYLHQHKPNAIIHRDLKSDNILLDKDMNVKICDFGIAKIDHTTTTSNGQTITAGTAQYKAPESYNGVFEPCSDVYSFGCVIFEILNGKRPWNGLSDLQIMMKIHGEKKTLDFSAIREDAPISLVELMKRCLDYDKRQRPSFPDINDFLRKLEYRALQQAASMSSAAKIRRVIPITFGTLDLSHSLFQEAFKEQRSQKESLTRKILDIICQGFNENEARNKGQREQIFTSPQNKRERKTNLESPDWPLFVLRHYNNAIKHDVEQGHSENLTQICWSLLSFLLWLTNLNLGSSYHKLVLDPMLQAIQRVWQDKSKSPKEIRVKWWDRKFGKDLTERNFPCPPNPQVLDEVAHVFNSVILKDFEVDYLED